MNVESYLLSMSHYRREHVSNRRYLSAEIMAQQMNVDFIEQFARMSYTVIKLKLHLKLHIIYKIRQRRVREM